MELEGQDVAVKVLHRNDLVAETAWETEISLMASMHSPHMVYLSTPVSTLSFLSSISGHPHWGKHQATESDHGVCRTGQFAGRNGEASPVV